jgi:hypothetical protein
MKKSVKIVFSILLLIILSMVGYFTYSIFGGETVYGKGKLIDLESNSIEIDGLKLNLNQVGYFQGNIPELLKDSSDVESYVILDLEIENTTDYNNSLKDLFISTNNGDNLYLYNNLYVEGSNKNISKDLLNKYHLLLTGPDFAVGEKIRGAIYIPMDELKDGEFTIVYSAGDETKEIKGKLGKEPFNDKELLELETMRTLKEDELKFGDLDNGIDLKIEDKEMKADGLTFKYSEPMYFNELKKEFTDSLMHLTAINGQEKLVILKVEVKNTTNDKKALGKFKIYRGEEDEEGIESVVTVGAEELSSGVLNEGYMDKYKLLNYRGFGPNLTPLDVNEVTVGNIIFYSSELVLGEEYYIGYSGVEENSQKLRLVLKK